MEIGGPLGNSDHSEIRFECRWRQGLSPNEALVPNFRKGDYKELRNYIGEVGHTMVGATLDDLYNNFVHELQIAQKKLLIIGKLELAVIVLNE